MNLKVLFDYANEIDELLNQVIIDNLMESDYCQSFFGSCSECQYNVICSNFNDAALLIKKNIHYLRNRIEAQENK